MQSRVGLIHVERELDPSGGCDPLSSFLLFMVKQIKVAKVQAFVLLSWTYALKRTLISQKGILGVN